MKAAALGVFVLAVALYLPTLAYDFTGWDDTAYVVDNPVVTSASQLSRIWTSPDSVQYYPLTFSSYWLEYRIWGARAAGYHATNVLLHAVNSVLVLLLLRSLGMGVAGAALGGALFAVHPLQVMSVAWVAERKNLLALLFTVLAVLAWIRSDDGRRRRVFYGLSLVLFAAALASKTVVLGLPVALALLDVLVRRRDWGSSLLRAAPMLVLSAGAAIVTVAFERAFVELGASVSTPGLAERLQIAGAAPWFYLAKLALPLRLSPAYAQWSVGAARPAWWLPLLVTLAALTAFVAWLPRLRTERSRRVAWLLAFSFLMLAPSLGLVPFGNLAVSFVSDHLLYIPAAGVFGIAGSLLDTRPAWPSGLIRAAGIVALAAATLAYSPVFRDAESLWSRVVKLDPDSYVGNLGMAEAWNARGRFAEALPRYERAIAARPAETDGYLVLGRAKLERGDAAGAAEVYGRALELAPQNVAALVGLASASERVGEIPKALALYERAVQAAPHDVPAHMGLGAMYLGFARPADALEQFRAVTDLLPAYPRAYLGAATSLRSLSRYGDAAETLRRGLAGAPADASLLNLLALTLATAPDDAVRDGPGAVALAERACEAGGPDSYELRATLAAAYAEAGRFEDALRESQRAEASATTSRDERSAEESRRRSGLYAAGLPLRLGK